MNQCQRRLPTISHSDGDGLRGIGQAHRNRGGRALPTRSPGRRLPLAGLALLAGCALLALPCTAQTQVTPFIGTAVGVPGGTATVPLCIDSSVKALMGFVDFTIQFNALTNSAPPLNMLDAFASIFPGFSVNGPGILTSVDVAIPSNTPDGAIYRVSVAGASPFAPQGLLVVSNAPIKPGDVNGDGRITIADAVLALRISLSLLAPLPKQVAAMEVDGSCQLDVGDVIAILRAAVGLPLPPTPTPLTISPCGDYTDPGLAGQVVPLMLHPDGTPNRDHFSHLSNDPYPHPFPYSTNPPTSGPHNPSPLSWGIFAGTIDDESAVHNLEHGGVWVSYQPSLDSADLARLTALVENYPTHVIMAPRAADDSLIALTSWGRILKLGSYDEAAIKNFLDKNRYHGPECIP